MEGASSTGRGHEVGVGRFGFVTLIGGALRVETECLILMQEEGQSVIACPPVEPLLTSEADWTDAGRSASVGPRQPTLVVDGCQEPLPLRRVSSSAVRVLPSKNDDVKRFEPRPTSATVLGAFYRSQYGGDDGIQEIKATSTDDGPRNNRQLENENRRLAKELAQYQAREMEQSRQSARSGRRGRAEKHRIATSGSEGDDDGSTSDAELASHEEEDALVRALQKFQFEGRKKSPGPASGAKTERGSRAAGSADAVVMSDLGDELGGERRQKSPKARRSARVSPSRRSPRRPRVRREHREVSPQRRLELEVQLEIVKQLQALRGGGTATSDDAPDANCLDGLRIMRSLGRMRALKERAIAQPEEICREYRSRWVKDLGAEGRAFRHIDVNKAVKWKKYTSMKRVHFMFCMILELMEQDKGMQARAQVVQCLKSIQEFAKHGSWRAAWELTYLPDPLSVNSHGGTEVEMETILGYLRTRDDLARKSSKGVQEFLSDAEEEDAPAVAPRPKKPAKKPKGGGKGKEENV